MTDYLNINSAFKAACKAANLSEVEVVLAKDGSTDAHLKLSAEHKTVCYQTFSEL